MFCRVRPVLFLLDDFQKWVEQIRQSDSRPPFQFQIHQGLQRPSVKQSKCSQSCANGHLWTTTTCQQRPAWILCPNKPTMNLPSILHQPLNNNLPLKNSHFLGVPRVAVVNRFYCIVKLCYVCYSYQIMYLMNNINYKHLYIAGEK